MRVLAWIGCASLPLLAAVDFPKQIEPILKKNCYGCHSAALQQNGLRLDRAADALRGGYSGPAILPGDGASSRIVAMTSSGKMPPAGRKLEPAEIELLKLWIDEGARRPADVGVAAPAVKSKHWSFQRIVRPAVPPVRGRVENPIDAFVLARLEKEKIAASPAADRATLLRRVTLDLTGLPATPAEQAAFLADTALGAYDRVVERLLASPHYGEKWARHWLDQARYADSDGYEKDSERPWAWRWRHWVIEALNRDLPFDEFTIQQLAGDLVPGATWETRAATGFLRNSLANREGGVDTEQFRVEQALDRTNSVGTVWMGLTLGCAQCHDHKYDPISQRDYYQMFAFFNPLLDLDLEAPLGGELGEWMRTWPEYEHKRDALMTIFGIDTLMRRWETELLAAGAETLRNEKPQRAWKNLGNISTGGQEVMKLERGKRPRLLQEQLIDYFAGRAQDLFERKELDAVKFDEWKKEWRALKAKAPQLSLAQTVRENWWPRKSHILLRGDFRSPGIEVAPGAPVALPPLPSGAQPSRLALARWLVSREHPLTARVAVNRAWQEFFGRGLVRTSEDMGKQGEPPVHAGLLDWLAAEFMEPAAQPGRGARPWSMKALHRLIVTSAAYKRSSKGRPDLAERDPGNALVARQARLRLSAEQIRDSALAAGGLLNPATGGPSVRPPQPAGVAELAYAGSVKWNEAQGAARYRRGLYIHFQRTTPYPQLMTFDAPDAVQSCSRRQRSYTPLQALNLLNDPVFFEAAQALSLRLVSEETAGFAARARLGYRVCVGREPSAEEVETLARHFERAMNVVRQDAKEARALAPAVLEGTPAVEGAGWVMVSRVLLNLDEFLHRE